MRHSLLGLAGWSGSGKTTLLEKLLPLLHLHLLRVNVIKSSHHDVEIEPDTKDSARMRAAGASEVMLASPFRYMLVHELRGMPEPSLDELLARMKPADLTLVEGFRQEPIPKMEVYRPSLRKPAQFPEDDNVIAVASDAPCPADLPRPIIWLDLNNPEQICDWLLKEDNQ